jgi:hypothetical protein
MGGNTNDSHTVVIDDNTDNKSIKIDGVGPYKFIGDNLKIDPFSEYEHYQLPHQSMPDVSLYLSGVGFPKLIMINGNKSELDLINCKGTE